jgi:hypothetical protein
LDLPEEGIEHMHDLIVSLLFMGVLLVPMIVLAEAPQED